MKYILLLLMACKPDCSKLPDTLTYEKQVCSKYETKTEKQCRTNGLTGYLIGGVAGAIIGSAVTCNDVEVETCVKYTSETHETMEYSVWQRECGK